MNDASFYSKQVLRHFRNPHNYGALKNPDGTGYAGNIVCGDVMSLDISVKKNNKGKEVIKNIKFKTYGCAAAIATSSVITDLAKEKTIEEALRISKDDIVYALKRLPPIKLHCSLLAIDALGEAIFNYLDKKGKPIPQELSEKHERIKKNREKIKNRQISSQLQK